jgi:hypothetical protein
MKSLLRLSAVAALALSLTLPIASAAKGKPAGGGCGDFYEETIYAAPADSSGPCFPFAAACEVPEDWVICEF